MHGAIASAAVYGAVLGATVDQIESAIGLVVAHYIPFRAIRAGQQLSDSKGASAAISAEVAVLSMRRAMRGFVGPADIFRNPEAIFCLFEPPARADASPFDLTLATAGDDFAVMGMHFKLGLYEHQSAGAIQGLIDLVADEPAAARRSRRSCASMRITIYEPAFSIIGDPAKRDPRTRQSADHSMVYIIATLLRKAFEARRAGWDGQNGWQQLMLVPADYADDESALFHPLTRELMERIDFRHGGPEYDRKYPDGIPTTVEIDHAKLGQLSSGLVMYPEGHARSRPATCDRCWSTSSGCWPGWASTTRTHLQPASPTCRTSRRRRLRALRLPNPRTVTNDRTLSELARQVRAGTLQTVARARSGVAHVGAARNVESHPLACRACTLGAGRRSASSRSLAISELPRGWARSVRPGLPAAVGDDQVAGGAQKSANRLEAQLARVLDLFVDTSDTIVINADEIFPGSGWPLFARHDPRLARRSPSSGRDVLAAQDAAQCELSVANRSRR